jgi:AcrR family transcriptional regulator
MLPIFQQEGKKGDLLRASLELFAARGYDAVSVRDIAKAAGVSEAALYKHFSGKQELAVHIFTAIITDYTERLRRIEAAPGGAVAKLCRIVDTTYDLYRDYPAPIRFALLSQYNFWLEVPEEIKPHFVIRRIIAAGLAAGEIPRGEVYFLLTAFSGLLLQPLAQYPYFNDVLPEFSRLKDEVRALVRKMFA